VIGHLFVDVTGDGMLQLNDRKRELQEFLDGPAKKRARCRLLLGAPETNPAEIDERASTTI